MFFGFALKKTGHSCKEHDIVMKAHTICFSIALMLLCLLSCGKATPPCGIAPIDLRCEYRAGPIDVESPKPRLSWVLQSGIRAQRQTAYRILVAGSRELLEAGDGDLWNSGWIESDRSAHITYDGSELRSRQRCFWKVRVRDRDGVMSDWSTAASWEMGILGPGEWKAEWIAYDCPSAPLLRKEFTVEKEVRDARAYICGLGYFELSVNGKRIGESVLDPGQTDYEERAFYVVHDVTGALRPGANAVGVMLGDGWYNQTAVDEPKYGWGDVVYGKPRMIFQLHVVYSDGTEALVVSDESWKRSPGPVLSNNVYAGEVYDARLELPGWDTPGWDDAGWGPVSLADPPGGVLVSQKLPPVRRMETLKPVGLANPRPGVYVFDMGHNFAGWTRLIIEAERGTTVQLRSAETVFEDGMIDPASTGVGAIHVIQTERYTCRGGGVEVWEPRFTYHGFRYVEMTGFPGEPALDNLEGIVVHTAVDRIGSFESSDDMLNRIHETAVRTLTSNLHSVPTDCPAREKCGWLGDAHVFAEMSIYNFDMPLFWSKFIRDIETNRRSRGGIVEDIAPGRRQEPGTHPDWGSAFIQLPWYLYLYYGDTAVLREHYRGMGEFMDHLQGLAKGHIIHEGYGDWCPPGGARPTATPVALTSTAYFHFDAAIMAEVARILGKAEDSERYRALAAAIGEAFNDTFYDPTEKTYGSQTADCFSLYLGLVPEGDGEAVARSLADDVVLEHGGHHSTGVTGSLHLFHELGKFGYGDVAHGILQNTDYPSIGYLFSLGATTLWESWGKRGGSLNHPMQGGFDVWFYNGIGGINPDPSRPGFRHTVFRFPVTGGMESADVGYRSLSGPIRSSWRSEGDHFHWDIAIPANTTATVYFPVSDSGSVMEGGIAALEAEGVRLIGSEGGETALALESGSYEFVMNK